METKEKLEAEDKSDGLEGLECDIKTVCGKTSATEGI